MDILVLLSCCLFLYIYTVYSIWMLFQPTHTSNGCPAQLCWSEPRCSALTQLSPTQERTEVWRIMLWNSRWDLQDRRRRWCCWCWWWWCCTCNIWQSALDLSVWPEIIFIIIVFKWIPCLILLHALFIAKLNLYSWFVTDLTNTSTLDWILAPNSHLCSLTFLKGPGILDDLVSEWWSKCGEGKNAL